MQADAVAAALAQAHRSEWAFVLSATVRVALWEGVRRVWARVFRWTPPTLVDATKLVPLTFVMVIALIAMGECSPSRHLHPGLSLLRFSSRAVENGLVRSL